MSRGQVAAQVAQNKSGALLPGSQMPVAHERRILSAAYSRQSGSHPGGRAMNAGIIVSIGNGLYVRTNKKLSLLQQSRKLQAECPYAKRDPRGTCYRCGHKENH